MMSPVGRVCRAAQPSIQTSVGLPSVHGRIIYTPLLKETCGPQAGKQLLLRESGSSTFLNGFHTFRLVSEPLSKEVGRGHK
jgi:hypothetical protein